MRAQAVLVCVVCCACGDNISVSGFRVVEVTPADGAAEVDVDTTVVLRFSEPVDPDSLDAIALTGVAAGLAADGSTVTLTPVARLPFDSELQVTATTALTSVTGDPLAAPWSSRFETRWRIWSEPEAIGPASGQVGASMFRPYVVGAATGDAVAVWEDDAEGAYRLSGARYAAADRTWSQDEEIASGGAEYPLGPQLAADAAGNMLLVWRSVERIEHAWYNPENSAWYHGAPVYIGAAVLTPPLVALSPGGKGAALWNESGTRMVARLDGDRWSPAETVGPGNADGAALAVGDDATITVVWRNGDRLAARRSEGDGWGASVPLWTDVEGALADRPRVAALPDGRALAVWGVVRADGAEVHARLFDPELAAWGDDEVIGTADTASDTLPELAVTGSDVLVVWDDWNGGLYGRWWRDGAWQDAVLVVGADVMAPEHALAVDGEGDAVTAFAHVSAATFWPDREGWSAGPVGDNAVTVPIAVTFAGPDPLAVWEHYSYDEAQGAPIQQGIRASFFR